MKKADQNVKAEASKFPIENHTKDPKDFLLWLLYRESSFCGDEFNQYEECQEIRLAFQKYFNLEIPEID